jgi:hypothetical protein
LKSKQYFSTRIMTQDNRENATDDKSQAAGLVAGGAAAGGGVAAGVGGMGLVGGFGGVAIGAAPVVAAGAVVGAAAYGAKKAIEEGDGNALGAMAGGAVAGAGVAAAIGGMGLAVGGGAIAIGMAPIAAAGAVLGLAGYGLSKLFGGNSEEKILEIEGKDIYLLPGKSNDKTLENKDSYPFM